MRQLTVPGFFGRWEGPVRGWSEHHPRSMRRTGGLVFGALLVLSACSFDSQSPTATPLPTATVTTVHPLSETIAATRSLESAATPTAIQPPLRIISVAGTGGTICRGANGSDCRIAAPDSSGNYDEVIKVSTDSKSSVLAATRASRFRMLAGAQMRLVARE